MFFFLPQELAEFEKMSNQVELSEDQLADDIRRGLLILYIGDSIVSSATHYHFHAKGKKNFKHYRTVTNR